MICIHKIEYYHQHNQILEIKQGYLSSFYYVNIMQIVLCHILSPSHQHPDMRHLHRVLSVRKCQTFKPLAVLLFPKPTGVSFPLIALLLFWQCVHGG